MGTERYCTVLHPQVTEVTPTEVYCVAKNTCRLDGLLTVFHQERSAEGLSNLQVRRIEHLPLLK